MKRQSIPTALDENKSNPLNWHLLLYRSSYLRIRNKMFCKIVRWQRPRPRGSDSISKYKIVLTVFSGYFSKSSQSIRAS